MATELQGVQDEISDDARKALARARKILDVASRPPDDNDTPAQRAAKEAERAVAVEKYQQVLLEYNLSQAMVDQTGADADGRREEAKMKAGMYDWQRNMWEAVAELNFCLYYCADTWREAVKTRVDRWSGEKVRRMRSIRGKEHQVIGRKVNTQATINLCTYIEAAIEKATREKLVEWLGTDDKQKITQNLMSRFAISFREGAADDIIQRVNAQRRDQLRKEQEAATEAAARAAAARSAGDSDGTALVIATYEKNELDLNTDHLHGKEPGTTARERMERAARLTAEKQRYTEWAAAHPEEAAAQAKAEREENRRRWARYGNGGGPGSRGGQTRDDKRDSRAYRQGAAAGAKIGLDIQTGTGKASGAIS